MSILSRGLWTLLFAYFTYSFFNATMAIENGDFDSIGLPAEMIAQELVGNAFQVIGWFTVLVLSFRRDPLFAPELCIFLSGMLFFDVQSTWPLDMPLPDGFLYWGTATCLLQIFAAVHLASRRRTEQDFI